MSKVKTMYAKVRFTDANGTHDEGDPVEVAVETDAQQAECDTLVRYGVLTPHAPTKNKGGSA